MLNAKFSVLLSLFRMGNACTKSLQRCVQSTTDLVDWHHLISVLSYLDSKGAFKSNTTKEIFLRNWHSTEQYCQQCQEMGIHIVPWYEKVFPQSLLLLSNPPIFLFIQGDINILDFSQSLSFVGGRNVSSFLMNVALRMSTVCAEQNYIIVSGLAQGCDTAAHNGCLQGRGKTIAVIPHGLGMPIYPATNANLAMHIKEMGGCLLSEFDIFAPPQKKTFLQRNRIIAALGSAMILVYGIQKSGSASSIRYARTLAKPVGFYWSASMQKDVSCLNYQLWKNGMGEAIQNKAELDVFLHHV